ncbi:MAG: hypothetical protein RL299_505, partial [Pseudomonadota bacterium]
MSETRQFLAEGRCDASGLLVSAAEPLAGLQLACGGDIPGAVAIPALRELVAKAQEFRLKLARLIHANDGRDAIAAWIEVEPLGDETCARRVCSWQVGNLPPEDPAAIAANRAAIDRNLAELTARLDPQQNLLS